MTTPVTLCSEFNIPDASQHKTFLDNKYNNKQLKFFLRFYKLKVSGNKKVMMQRLYDYLKYSYCATKIQSIWRGVLRRTYNYYKGPVTFNMKCTNTDDFLTLSAFNNHNNFFSYKDSSGFIYGFNAASFNELTRTDLCKNPYNRQPIDEGVIYNFKQYINMGKVLGEKIQVDLESDPKPKSIRELINSKIQKIFQTFNELGHITNPDWFFNLSHFQIKILFKELIDIWEYRANLSHQVKITICPPNGNPFDGINRHHDNINNIGYMQFKIMLINVFDNILYKSNDNDAKSLGAYYILGSMTLVSDDARQSMPWLFESFNLTNNTVNV